MFLEEEGCMFERECYRMTNVNECSKAGEISSSLISTLFELSRKAITEIQLIFRGKSP